MFESLTRRPLHPMQYLLVGLSLVLFYLVLLALSEHIGFTAAWLAASLSGAVMNGIYLQAVLRGWRNSLLFVAALLLLDGVMWFLLHSEDSALLLGTGVLALALSVLMFLTRRVDWYALSLPKGTVPPTPAADDDKLRLWKSDGIKNGATGRRFYHGCGINRIIPADRHRNGSLHREW